MISSRPGFQEIAALIALLKTCARKKDLHTGLRAHADIHRRGLLGKNSCLGSTLVSMYSKCGAFAKAEDVLEDLPVRNVVSWNALIAGYVQQEHAMEALSGFECMQIEGHSPDVVTYRCILKACGSIGAVEIGTQMHSEILKQGLLDGNIVLGNTLVDMYAKCGVLAKAREVLEGLVVRNVVSWNALIAGYAQEECAVEVLHCFEQMQHESISPDATTFACVLKVCGSIKALENGKKLHRQILRQTLLDDNIILGNALVDMYAKCGALTKSKQVLDGLCVRDAVSWNALVSGYTQERHFEEAVNCFEQMQFEGLSPNAVTFACILKACGNIGALEKGINLHSKITQKGLLDSNILLGTALVDMYVKCDAFAKAKEVLGDLHACQVVSWNALIAGCAKRGHAEEALDYYEQMQCEGFSADAATFVCILKACSGIGALDKGEKIHLEISQRGLLHGNVILGNALVDMYAKCGALVKATDILEGLSARDVVSWNTLMSGYVLNEQHKVVLDYYYCLQHEGILPNIITFVCTLKACGSIGALDRGEEIHFEIVEQGLLDENLVLGNAVLEMYTKCGALTKAADVLEELPVRHVVIWSSLIAGYVQEENGKAAFNCFIRMQHEGISPDVVTFACVLNACSSIGSAYGGEILHSEIKRLGLLHGNVVLGNALVNMYAKCGSLEEARKVFEGFSLRDVVSWNALIGGYVQGDNGKEALTCFEQMHYECPFPDAITFVCLLKTCSRIGALTMGERLHAEIVRQRLLDGNINLGNALVDMYAKCGAVAKAKGVFEMLSFRDVVSWNALISGYVEEECGMEAVNCFGQMQFEGLSPDEITFAIILSACSHLGLLQEGKKYFLQMGNNYGITTKSVHHTCIIDLLGHVGLLERAVAVIKKMPYLSYYSLWVALLNACQRWGNVKVGRWAFEHALHLHGETSTSFFI